MKSFGWGVHGGHANLRNPQYCAVSLSGSERQDHVRQLFFQVCGVSLSELKRKPGGIFVVGKGTRTLSRVLACARHHLPCYILLNVPISIPIPASNSPNSASVKGMEKRRFRANPVNSAN